MISHENSVTKHLNFLPVAKCESFETLSARLSRKRCSSLQLFFFLPILFSFILSRLLSDENHFVVPPRANGIQFAHEISASVYGQHIHNVLGCAETNEHTHTHPAGRNSFCVYLIDDGRVRIQKAMPSATASLIFFFICGQR